MPTTRKPAAETDLTTPPDAEEADMPHERDESVGMTGGIPDETVRQGHRDVEKGLKDTSRSEATNEAYTKLKK